MILRDLKSYLKQEIAKIVDEHEIKSIVDILLLQHVGLNAISVNLNPNIEIEKDILDNLNKDLLLLSQHCPIQYVVGNTEFYNLKLNVSPDVLIPRQETEELVDWIIKSNHAPKKCLDVCTGSACIAIALAKNLPQTNISACDISSDALKVASQNAEMHSVNIHFFQMDILSNQINNFHEKFDLIVSNPPYVTLKEKTFMHKRVLDFEPNIALFVPDEQPLLFYESIARLAKQNLQQNGYFYVEINENLGKETLSLFQKLGFSDLQLKQDLNGKDRMIRGKLETK